MSISTVSVLMLLRSMSECSAVRYVMWRLSDGFMVTDYERNITVKFEDTKLQISWLQLVNYVNHNDEVDWKILHEVMSISEVCLVKLCSELFEIGNNKIIHEHSFSPTCYLRRGWDDIDGVYDYYYHTDNGEELKTVAIPARRVLINSKQYNIYVNHLNEFASSVYAFKMLYTELDNWFDMRVYELPNSVGVLKTAHRYINESFPELNCKAIHEDGVYQLFIDNFLFKELDTEPGDVLILATFDLEYLINSALIKRLCEPTLLFFLYIVHAITVKYSLEREIR